MYKSLQKLENIIERHKRQRNKWENMNIYANLCC